MDPTLSTFMLYYCVAATIFMTLILGLRFLINAILRQDFKDLNNLKKGYWLNKTMDRKPFVPKKTRGPDRKPRKPRKAKK